MIKGIFKEVYYIQSKNFHNIKVKIFKEFLSNSEAIIGILLYYREASKLCRL